MGHQQHRHPLRYDGRALQLTAFSAAPGTEGQLSGRGFSDRSVTYLTASDFSGCYTGAMANVIEAELVEMYRTFGQVSKCRER
jgi:hypothetical protein